MNIDKILFVCDNNLNYLSFWNSVSRFYKTTYSIHPHLFFIGSIDETNQKYLSNKYGDVTCINPIKNIPIIIQALWGKFWFTQTELDTNWLIGDIDLYLLNKDYLKYCLNNIPNNSYAHLNANGYKLGNWWDNPFTGIPGYWHLAKGSLFKEYLDLSDSFQQDCEFIYHSKKYGILYNGLISKAEHAPNRVKDKDHYGYICCEEHLSTERLIPHKDSIFNFTYPTSLTRLESTFGKNGQPTPCDFDLFGWYSQQNKTQYIDFHAPRPYNCFSQAIEQILSSISD